MKIRPWMWLAAVAVLVIVVAGVSSAVTASNKAAAAGSVNVTLDGSLTGDGFAIGSDASVVSTEADETYLMVSIERTSEDASNETPTISATISLADGSELECESFRGHIWSSGVGSLQGENAMCNLFVPVQELDIQSVRLS